MTESRSIEERSFKLHENTLKSVIMQQAGTLEKAFMELIMNSVDAGASRVDITINDDFFEVKDDGKGFNGKDEIISFFETFGTPHEDGDAEYGRFRMGRGQIMPFAKTTWRSDSYSMITDLRNTKDSLGYTLVSHDQKEDGCIVSGTIYPEVLKSTSNQHKLEHTIPKNIKFIKTPIFLNGTRANIDPVEFEWDYETDEAYFKINHDSNEIHLYNLGVFVSTRNSYNYYGIGGIVVSKKALNVNFARNDVIAHECAVYTKIEEKLRTIVAEKNKKSKKLNFSEKKFYVDSFLYLDLQLYEFADKYVFTMLNNKSINLTDLRSTSKNRMRIALSEVGHENEAEYCMNKNIATVFKREILELFEVDSLQAFLDKLRKTIGKSIHITSALTSDNSHRNNYLYRELIKWLDTVKIVNLADYSGVIDSNHTLVKGKDLTDKERLILKVIKTKNNSILTLASKISGEPIGVRTIFVGNSSSYDGWTDGRTYIVVNRNVLNNADYGITGLSKIFSIVLHEYLHTNFNTSESHPHNLEFYENFHNAILNIPQHEGIVEFARAAVMGYFTGLIDKKMKISKKVAEDSMHLSTRYDQARIDRFNERIKESSENKIMVRDLSSQRDVEMLNPFWFGIDSRYTVEEVISRIDYYIGVYFKMKSQIEQKLLFNMTLVGVEKLGSFVDYLILNSKCATALKELNKNIPMIEKYERSFLESYTDEIHPLLSHFLDSKRKVLSGLTEQGK